MQLLKLVSCKSFVIMTEGASTSAAAAAAEKPTNKIKDDQDVDAVVHPRLREKLEKMEIDSPGCVVPFEVYGQLLAVYLYENDL